MLIAQRSSLIIALAVVTASSIGKPAFSANPSLGSSETSNIKVCMDFERSYEDLALICDLALATDDLDPKTKLSLHRRLGDVYDNLGRTDDARAQYTAASKTNVLDARPLVDLGWSYWMTDEYDLARDVFERALSIDSNPSALAGLASVLRKTDADHERALELLDQSLLISPDYTWAIVERGWILNDMGQPHSALVEFDRALDVDPGYDQAHYGAAWVHDDLDDAEAALAAINAAISYDPEYAIYYGYRAYIMRMAENYRAAIDDAGRALELDPAYGYAALQKALSQKALGYLDRGLATLNDAASAGASGNSFFYDFADMLTYRSDWVGALERIDRAITYPQANHYDHDLRAYILLQLDRDHDALQAARAAGEFDPSYYSADLNAGYANLKLGDDIAALEDIQAARQNGASSEDIDDIIRFLVNRGDLLVAVRFRLALRGD